MTGSFSILNNYIIHLGFAITLGILIYLFRNSIQIFLIENTKTYQNDPEKQKNLFVLRFFSWITTTALLMFIGINNMVAIPAGIIAGYFVPKMIEKRKRQQYIDSFDHALVESLTGIASSLKAGLTISGSLEVSLSNSPPVFSQQVALALKEHRFGKPLEEALDGIRKRIGSPHTNIAFGAMIIGNQIGGNLPDILKKIVETIRERERVSGKLDALTAQGRTQSILLCSAPPAIGIMMYLWDPEKIALFTTTFAGQVLLSLAVALELIGIFATKKIMELDI